MRKLLVVVAGVLVATTASAQGYFGGGLGRTYFAPNTSDWQPPGGSASFSKNDNAVKAFGGSSFTPNFGYEIALAYLGNYKANVSSPAPDSGLAKVKITSLDFFLTGKAPMSEKFSLTGKLGMALNHAQMSFTSGGIAFAATDGGTDNRWSAAWSVGGAYALDKNLSLRVEYEDFGKAGQTNNNFTVRGATSASRPNLWSLNIQSNF